MTYAVINTGAASIGFNVTLTPAMPAGFVAGNLLLLMTGSYIGSLATPTITGWTLLTPGVHARQVALYGKIAVGSDASPSVTWGNQLSFAFVTAYSGNPSTLTGIVHASIDQANNSTNSIGYAALAVTQPNCLVIAGGTKDKTTASDGATWSTISGFSIRNTAIYTDTAFNAVMNDQIQTSATSLSAVSQTMSKADSVAYQYQSFVIALLPASAPGPTLTAGSGSFSLAGQSATLGVRGAAFTLIGNPGAFNIQGAPATSDLELDAQPGAFLLKGEPVTFSFPTPFKPATPDPNQFHGHWKHRRAKEVAKIKRIELALRRTRGEIKDEPLHVEPPPTPAPLPVIPGNARGMAEGKTDLSELLAAVSAKPAVSFKSTDSGKSLRQYEEEIKQLMNLVPALTKH